MWFENVPTVWTANGQTTYIGCPSHLLPKTKEAEPWIVRAKDRGEYPIIVTRAALACLDAKVLTDARVTVDVAAPLIGTKEEQAAAVEVKLATPITPDEWDKVQAALAKVAEPVDEKVIEEAIIKTR